jgi:hypothetical protein
MAINYLNNVDFNRNELQDAQLIRSQVENQPNDAAVGGTPVEGQLYFNTTSDVLKVYANGAWVEVGGGVISLTLNDGTYIDVNSSGTPANPVFAPDLSAVDGTAVAATRFLSKDNTWDVPAFPAPPTVNNGTLTMTTTTGLDGSATFTANQSTNSAFTVSLDLTEISLGPGLDSTTTGLTLDLSEFTDMTDPMLATDEFIVLDSGAERRKAANEIGLSIFDNDAGFITSASLPTVSNATITLTAGNILDGGGAFTLNQAANETITFDLATGGIGAGIYGSASDSIKVDTIAVDQYGRVTAITTGNTGQVNTVVSGDTNTLSHSGTINKTLTPVTAAVANNGTALATGDQIYDFVTGQIANIPSGLAFEGNWNANTDTPDLSTATPDNGQFWIVSVAGSTDLDGITDWKVGDWAIYVSTGAGTDGWQKVDNTSTLSGAGVAGQVSFWTGTANVAGDAGFTYNSTTNNLAVGNNITAGGVMTASGGNSTEWNTGYDNMITGFSDSGSGTITLTLTQQDGGTLSTSFANPQGTMSSWTIKEGNGTESTTVTDGETLTIAQGTGIESEMTSTASGGTITITNTDRGSSQNIFKNVASSSGTAVADNNNDTLTVVGAGGISTAVSGDTLTITSSNGTNSDFTKVGTIAIGALSGTVTHAFGINTMVQTIDSSGNTVYCDISRTTTSVVATISATQTTAITILVQKIG